MKPVCHWRGRGSPGASKEEGAGFRNREVLQVGVRGRSGGGRQDSWGSGFPRACTHTTHTQRHRTPSQALARWQSPEVCGRRSPSCLRPSWADTGDSRPCPLVYTLCPSKRREDRPGPHPGPMPTPCPSPGYYGQALRNHTESRNCKMLQVYSQTRWPFPEAQGQERGGVRLASQQPAEQPQSPH